MDQAILYTWVKTAHLLFVIAWMASVFYLPRILVNLTETVGQVDVQARLQLKISAFVKNLYSLHST